MGPNQAAALDAVLARDRRDRAARRRADGGRRAGRRLRPRRGPAAGRATRPRGTGVSDEQFWTDFAPLLDGHLDAERYPALTARVARRGAWSGSTRSSSGCAACSTASRRWSSRAGSAREPRPTCACSAGTDVRAVALVLHGGQETSKDRAHRLRPAYLRMLPFARDLRRAGRDAGLAVWALRYRYRGWNAPEPRPGGGRPLGARARSAGRIPACRSSWSATRWAAGWRCASPTTRR